MFAHTPEDAFCDCANCVATSNAYPSRSKPLSERDEQMYDSGFSAGLKAGEARSAAVVEHLKAVVERSSDKIVRLVTTLNEIRAIEALQDAADADKNVKVAEVLSKLAEALVVVKTEGGG